MSVVSDGNGGEFLAAHARFCEEGGAKDAPWLQQLREGAIGRFSAQGLPHKKLEEWRYTDLTALSELRLAHDAARATDLGASLDFAGLAVLKDAVTLVVVDGRFARVITGGELPEGLWAGSIAEALREQPQRLEQHLGRHASPESDSMVALNSAFISDGVFVHLGRDLQLEQPLEVIFVATGAVPMQQPRLLLVAESGSRAQLVERYVGHEATRNGDDDSYLSNAVSELVLEAGAHVSHVRVQEEGPGAYQIGRVEVTQHKGSNYRGTLASFGGRLSRVALCPHLVEQGASCEAFGLFLGSGQQHHDFFSIVDHAAPHCDSRQLVKGVLDDEADAAFFGKVVVRKDAQKSNASQYNKNLVLSPKAAAMTRPQLEIDADDVKCGHGATVGQLDPDQVFYLRSRGVALEEAKRELTLAFVREVLAEVQPAALREHLETLLRGRGEEGRPEENRG